MILLNFDPERELSFSHLKSSENQGFVEFLVRMMNFELTKINVFLDQIYDFSEKFSLSKNFSGKFKSKKGRGGVC